ncbi:cilia- and flagella-associated protein 45 [Lonchura striata]
MWIWHRGHEAVPTANATITPGPLAHQVHTGDPVTVRCLVQVGSAPVTFTWLHNGQEVAQIPSWISGTSKWDIQAPTTARKPQDWCPDHPAPCGAPLDVDGAVNPVTLTCQGSGMADATTWYKEWQCWGEQEREHVTVTERHTCTCDRLSNGLSPVFPVLLLVPVGGLGAPLDTGPRLDLQHVGVKGSGCNQCGDSVAKSVPLNVTILVPVANATITPGPLAHQVRAGDPLTLRCSVQVGSAPVTFTWLHNGQEVAQSPLLELRDIDVGHSGTYQCMATNQLGQDEHHMFRAPSPELALEVTTQEQGTAVAAGVSRSLLILVLLVALFGGCHWWHHLALRKQQERAPPEALAPSEAGAVLYSQVIKTKKAGVARKQSPPINGKEELTDRLWEGPGLADATRRGIKGKEPILKMSHMVTGYSSPIVILQDMPKQPELQSSIRYKPKSTRIITRDLIRSLVIPQERPKPSLIVGEKEYERIKESARAPTEVEHWDRLKTLRARQEAAFEALKKAQIEEQRKAELEDKRDHRRDVEEVLQQEEKKLLQRAARMRLEQEEDVRELNALFLNAKCNMIRDKQVLEKQMIHKELVEEEKRLDKMMEMEREKGMEVQEELERQRKQELIRARHDIVKQMEQRAEEQALRAEELYQEGQRQLERLEQMKREDRKAWEQKQERLKQIHADIKRFNVESQRLKDQQWEQDRLEDEQVLKQQRQKAERKAALEAKQQQLRLEKEKELAQLRVTQQRAQDWQAEQDALRAKRNQEVADREWRRRELEKARKKAELEQQLKQDRLEQVAQKEQYLAMQVEQDRQEFQKVLRAHQEQLEREKLEWEQRELRQRAHAEYLRQQIQELQQQRQRERAALIAEGRQQQQEVRQRSQRLAQFRQQKLQEFRATGMPEKYCAQVEHKADS